MPEKIIPQQERTGLPEDLGSEQEFISPAEVISLLDQAQLDQLVSISEFVSKSKMRKRERSKKIQEIDQFSFEQTGYEVSEDRYCFPDELPNFISKEDYHEIGTVIDIGSANKFQLLPRGEILIQREDAGGAICSQDTNGTFKEEPAQWVPFADYDEEVFYLPGDKLFSLKKNNLYIVDKERRSGSHLNLSVEQFQLIGGGRAIAKSEDGFYFLSGNPEEWSYTGATFPKIWKMPERCEFKVFSDGRMIVFAAGELMTFTISENGKMGRVSNWTRKRNSFLAIDFVSGDKITTQVDMDKIFKWHLESVGWKHELFYTAKSTAIREFKTLPDGRIVVREDLDVIKIVERLNDGQIREEILENNDPTHNFHATQFQVAPNGKIFVLYRNGIEHESYIKIFDGTPIKEEANG